MSGAGGNGDTEVPITLRKGCLKAALGGRIVSSGSCKRAAGQSNHISIPPQTSPLGREGELAGSLRHLSVERRNPKGLLAPMVEITIGTIVGAERREKRGKRKNEGQDRGW